MNWLIYIAVYFISYLFGSFAFPQIIGSLRMISNGIKTPYTFALCLWSVIFITVTVLVHIHMDDYFITYLIGLILPFLFTLQTKNIE